MMPATTSVGDWAMADDKKQKTLFLDDPGAAAPPQPSPISSQSTMMLEAPTGAPAAQPRQMVVPTMMKMGPSGELPPMRRPRRQSTWGRWVAGPIISALVAAGTVAGAGALLPKKGGHGKIAEVPQKPQGHLRVNTDPPGASLLVDGKRYPRFTPTTVDGDIGATIKLEFQLDGYKPKEAEVYVGEGEHNFTAKLELAAPTPAPTPTAAPTVKHEHHHSSAPKEAEGKGTISVLVRPWAIVYIDTKRLKQTPVSDYELPSGKHVVELVNEGKNRREKIEVVLKPGESQEIKRDWDK
jgi:hypothetical protein